MATQRHSMQRCKRTVAVAAIGLCPSLMGGGIASASPAAHAAKSLNVTENAALHLVRRSGSTLYESGTATGTLPGRVTAVFDVGITKVTGSVTFYPRNGGSLTINVLGHPTSAGVNARFAGSLAVRRGTGPFKNAVGSGTFEGTVNRRTWAATVTARARLTY
jgi:hypothetical protein